MTTDHLGSPRLITNQNGAVTKRQDFAAFGDETLTAQRAGGLGYASTDELRQDYTGYQKDNESGLEYAQARYYNTAHGRFTSVDPLTASATIRDPQSFNRYSYVLNSPYKFTDPLGLAARTSGSFCAQWCQNSGPTVDGSAFRGRDTTFGHLSLPEQDSAGETPEQAARNFLREIDVLVAIDPKSSHKEGVAQSGKAVDKPYPVNVVLNKPILVGVTADGEQAADAFVNAGNIISTKYGCQHNSGGCTEIRVNFGVANGTLVITIIPTIFYLATWTGYSRADRINQEVFDRGVRNTLIHELFHVRISYELLRAYAMNAIPKAISPKKLKDSSQWAAVYANVDAADSKWDHSDFERLKTLEATRRFYDRIIY
ncbi:MAG: RHS repeat-associated core domain-containing protein [Acidobacteria bacterium]|nr:RHS repeat-associated core domain-containing protein [Acidobacteriota bacterium]